MYHAWVGSESFLYMCPAIAMCAEWAYAFYVWDPVRVSIWEFGSSFVGILDVVCSGNIVWWIQGLPD